MNNYSCYILISNTNTRTYIGCSNNINRRLRQHNGEIVGGAKATRKGRPWRHICEISGFTKSMALCCEWRLKRRKACNSNKLVPFCGVNNKIKNLYDVLNLEKYTKKCELSKEMPIKLTWYLPEYRIDDEKIPDHVEEIIDNNDVVII